MNKWMDDWRSVLSAERGVNFMNDHCVAARNLVMFSSWWFLYSFVTLDEQWAWLFFFLDSLNSFVSLVIVFLTIHCISSVDQQNYTSEVKFDFLLMLFKAKMPLMIRLLVYLNSRWRRLSCSLCFSDEAVKCTERCCLCYLNYAYPLLFAIILHQ